MEDWNKGNKMIRKALGSEDPTEYISQATERLRGMESLASTHITWYTHKNPYGCWICDMFLLSQRLIDTFEEFLGPTPATAENQSTLSREDSTNTEDFSEEEDEA